MIEKAIDFIFDHLMGILIALIVVVGGGGTIAFTIAWNQHVTTTCTIDAKQATAKEGGTKYLVFTKDCGAFQVADDMLNGKWNSSDTYASLKEGQRYTLDTVGWRNGFFSTYPNILSATERR